MTKTKLMALTLMAALSVAVTLFAAACGGSAETTTTAAAATESGKIVVSGLVDSPMTFAALDMDYMDWVKVTADNPTSGSASYDGVKLSDIFSYFGVKSDAKTVAVTGSDGTSTDITLADISGDALLARADDDSFSLVMPGQAADAWVQDVVSMEFK